MRRNASQLSVFSSRIGGSKLSMRRTRRSLKFGSSDESSHDEQSILFLSSIFQKNRIKGSLLSVNKDTERKAKKKGGEVHIDPQSRDEDNSDQSQEKNPSVSEHEGGGSGDDAQPNSPAKNKPRKTEKRGDKSDGDGDKSSNTDDDFAVK